MENENNDPQWKPNNMKENTEVIITLEKGMPIATGNSQYGEWRLWVGQIENALVYEKKTNKPIQDYTGKVIFFPSNKLHEKIMEHTNGTKENTKIGVTKTFVSGKNGSPFTVFETRLINDGSTPSSNLTDLHYKFLDAFNEMKNNKIFDGTKDDMTNFAKTDTWGIRDNIIIEKLWKVQQERN